MFGNDLRMKKPLFDILTMFAFALTLWGFPRFVPLSFTPIIEWVLIGEPIMKAIASYIGAGFMLYRVAVVARRVIQRRKLEKLAKQSEAKNK